MAPLRIPGLPTAFLDAVRCEHEGKLLQAIAAYWDALASEPGFEPALANLRALAERHVNLAYSERRNQNLRGAIAAFELAFAADRSMARSPSRLFELASFYLEAQEPDRGAEILLQAIEIAPHNIVLYQQLAFAQSRDGTWQRAAASLGVGIERITGWGPTEMAGLPIRSACQSEGVDFIGHPANHYVPVRPRWIEDFGSFRLLLVGPRLDTSWMSLPPVQHSESFVAALDEVDLVGTQMILSKNAVQRLAGYNAIGGNFELRHLMWLATHVENSWPNSVAHLPFPEGAIAFASDICSNYYHWLFDNLSRMALIERFPELRSFPIVYPAYGAPFVRETLEMLEWPGSLVSMGPGINRFPRLYVPSRSWPDDRGTISSQDVHWLRSRFDRFRGREGLGARRIFISRGAAARRRVLDEDALCAELERYGFLSVRLESLSVKEQISLFAGAEVIVAPHGAGLTNLVYAPEGAVTVELASGGTELNALYAAISASISGRHAILQGEPTNERGGKRIDPAAVDPQMRPSLALDEDYKIETRTVLDTLTTLGLSI